MIYWVYGYMGYKDTGDKRILGIWVYGYRGIWVGYRDIWGIKVWGFNYKLYKIFSHISL